MAYSQEHEINAKKKYFVAIFLLIFLDFWRKYNLENVFDTSFVLGLPWLQECDEDIVENTTNQDTNQKI